MDPIAHAFTGAALAAAGLRRKTPLATAALVLGANAPDIDALSYFAGPFEAFAFRRGWTHGVLAIAVLPFVVTGLVLLWDRWCRRGRTAASPARVWPLLGLAALAVLTHPTLDWLNNYGLRWLMPFDGRWFYGDALFIIDPWFWLVLGGALTLTYSRTRAALAGWSAFWLIASVIVLATPFAPGPARALWVTGLLAIVAARSLGFAAPGRARGAERTAIAALLLIGVYSAANAIADLPARAAVRAALEAEGLGPVQRVMVAPLPANPFAGDVVAETPGGYRLGQWHWLGHPRFILSPAAIPRNVHEPIVAAAAKTIDAEHFLSWARFPYADVEPTTGGGYLVRLFDARYAGMGVRLAGPTVRLDSALRPVEER